MIQTLSWKLLIIVGDWELNSPKSTSGFIKCSLCYRFHLFSVHILPMSVKYFVSFTEQPWLWLLLAQSLGAYPLLPHRSFQALSGVDWKHLWAAIFRSLHTCSWGGRFKSGFLAGQSDWEIAQCFPGWKCLWSCWAGLSPESLCSRQGSSSPQSWPVCIFVQPPVSDATTTQLYCTDGIILVMKVPDILQIPFGKLQRSTICLCSGFYSVPPL